LTKVGATLERYFANYGYLGILVTSNLMRIEFHEVSSGLNSKSPSDVCTVDLHHRKLTTSETALSSIPTRRRLLDLKKKALLL